MLSKKVPDRVEESGEGSGGETTSKKRKVEQKDVTTDKEPYKILGGRIYGHEIESIDWDEERRKRKEYLEKGDEMRKKRICEANRLETG